MDIKTVLQNIAEDFSKLDYVDAVVLSGSKTGLINDELSDYDIYIYSEKTVPVDVRRDIAQKYTDNYETGNTFFEDGDEWMLKEPKAGIDIMYRCLEWALNETDGVWRKHNAKVGYTTCFIHNLRTSKIIFDKEGKFQKLKDELNEPYPEQLKQNIIAKNYPLLRTKSASFYEQLEYALERDDYVSQNHRLSALLSSYFDILFAINYQTHPGEKKLVKYAQKLCKNLPADFEEDIKRVVKCSGTDNVLPALNKLLDELDKIM